ncbi:hypothetical protein N657DRAFT_644475 [Parathielavia appendiculata]|uniref:Uncharacterized protein n=1 Tax=Parathielavia appendiculata TaxID=2587402 RepID=A0AAN6U0T5_9PEZI|nr:hypothetical protein N657DRAFT_644475 [Parathielavia appendiculata]
MPSPSKTTLKAAVSRCPASHPAADSQRNSNLSPPRAARIKPAAGILTTGTTAAGRRTARITTTTAACSAAATTSTSRHPLRLRDQNATQTLRAVKPRREATKSPVFTASKMPPYERPPVAGHRQPTVARAVNKPPLTPKIAARAPTSQQPPTLATTPLGRRPPSESTVNASGSRDRDDLTSPVSAFLSSNITPRSGSRQSRVDSVNSTPNSTPNPDRNESLETRSGLGVPGGDDTHRKPALTFSPPSEVGTGAKQDRDSKFFYASDAQKPTPQPTSSRSPPVQQPKPPTFFYANGNVAPERPGAPPVPFSPPLTSLSSQDGLMSKFIYANGAPELQPAAKIGRSPQTSSGSVVSTASRLPTSKQGSIPRATSPVKHQQHAAPPKPGGSTATSPRSPGPVISSQGSNQPSLAKVGADTHARPKSHISTKSGATPEPPATTRRVSAQSSVPSSGSTSPLQTPQPGLTLPPNPASAGFSSLLQAAEDFAGPPEDAQQPESLNSPTKTSSQDGQQATEDLVTNARRERKVQDLEITNASLEAINRTLERQLRKQTAELRRYQRLSRSGRLSFGSTVAGSRVPSESTVDGGGLARAGMGLDDLSEEESEIAAEDAELEELEEEEEDDGDVSGSEASGAGDLSLGANELRQRKRRRDERRLQLDLSKHQQLLVDSQKINQSLKRCLGWTEELIKEGKRALAYQVRVSDVELGGRVLAPEEVEIREREDDEAAEDVTLGDETIHAVDALGGGSLAEADASSAWSKGPQDRDSGIELTADGG